MRIKAGKTSGADALLNGLRNHAAQTRENPQLHRDIRDFSALIAGETIRLASEYKRYKAERGLVDFTDLEIIFLELLEDENLSSQLAADFDLVLVDEFQDTNPLQLAIFQRVRILTPRAAGSAIPSRPFMASVIRTGTCQQHLAECSRPSRTELRTITGVNVAWSNWSARFSLRISVMTPGRSRRNPA